MEFKHLLSFVTATKLKSFSKAAEALYISQPSITTHIQTLEEELGCPLLIRNAKSFCLTKEGQAVYDYAEKILKLKDRMTETCAANQTTEIHIGASTIPSAYLLPKLISNYLKEHEGISFSINQSDSREIVSGVADRIYDLGFVGAKYPSKDLTYVPLCSDRMVIIAPKAPYYEELYRDRTKYSDKDILTSLLKSPLIVREEGSGSGLQLQRVLNYVNQSSVQENRFDPLKSINIAARINDHEAIKDMVRCGIGIACLSSRVVNSDSEDFYIFSLPEEISVRELCLVFRKMNTETSKISDFAQFCIEKSASLIYNN